MAAVAVPGLADTVPVAARPLVAGTVIADGDLSQAEVADNKIYGGTPRTAEEIIGKRLSRTLKAGDTFNTATLKATNDVERNSAVTVLFKRPGIELSGTGVAMEAGSTGKAIRIMNTETRTTVVATVSGPGTVTIGDVQ